MVPLQAVADERGIRIGGHTVAKMAAAACLAALGVGCSLLPPSNTECVDVAAATCQAAVKAAESAIFLQSGEVVERRVVHRTEVMRCMEEGTPVFDVDFHVQGIPEPITITLVNTEAERLVAWTY